MRVRTMLWLNYSCFACIDPTSSQTRVVCLCTDTDSTDTDIDSSTDEEDVESFITNFVSLLCR
jgi:hypothetical protein